MRERPRRYLMFACGVGFCALGIGFITRAALGTSPISSVPFVLSLITPPTLGLFTLVFNALFLVAEAAIRRSFTRRQVLQIPFIVLFSLCIDGALWLIPSQLYGPSYLLKLAYLLFGCALMALGITLEVLADVTMLPGEAVVRAIAETRRLPFPTVKVVFDISLTAAAAAIALPAFGRLNGVGVGTVLAALLVGRLVGGFTRRLGPLLTAPQGRAHPDPT